MRIVTVSNVRDKVQELFPNLAPFELKKDRLDELVENWEKHMTFDTLNILNNRLS